MKNIIIVLLTLLFVGSSFYDLKAQHSDWDLKLTISEELSRSNEYKLETYSFSGLWQSEIDELRSRTNLYSGTTLKLDENFFKSRFIDFKLIDDKILSEIIVSQYENQYWSVRIKFVYTDIPEDFLNCKCKGKWVQRGEDLLGDSIRDQFGWSVSMSSNGKVVAIGALGNTGGYVKMYKWQENKWIPKGDVITGDNDSGGFGGVLSLSADGNTVVIGSPSNSKHLKGLEGSVKVFKWIEGWLGEEGEWVQKGQTIYGENKGDFFGHSVAINETGKIIAVGTGLNMQKKKKGYVKVFEWDDSFNEWKRNGSTLYDKQKGRLGFSVDLDGGGRTTAVGVPSYGRKQKGHVKVWYDPFFEDGTEQVGKTIKGFYKNDHAGEVISINSNGDVIAISARGDLNDEGKRDAQVRVYKQKSGEWRLLGFYVKNDNWNSDQITSLDLNKLGHAFIIGISTSDSTAQDSGRAIVFEWNGKKWCKKGVDLLGVSKDEKLGKSVSISGDGNVIMVSATGSDINGSESGQVRIFEWKDN